MIGGTTSQNFLLDFGDNTTQQQQQRVAAPKAAATTEAPEFGIDLEREYEHIEGLTENFYTKAGKLKQLAASALKAGFDITAPDMTDPLQRQLSNLFMQSYAATQAQANQLYNSNKLLFEASKRKLEDPTFQIYNQGAAPFSLNNVGSTELLPETKEVTDLYAKTYDDPNARDQAQQAINSRLKDFERRRDLSDDPKEKALMQIQVDHLKNAVATFDVNQILDRRQRQQLSDRDYLQIEPVSAVKALINFDKNHFNRFIFGDTQELKPVYHNGKIQLRETKKDGRVGYIDFSSPGGYRQLLTWEQKANPTLKIDNTKGNEMYAGFMNAYNFVDTEPIRMEKMIKSSGIMSLMVHPDKKDDFVIREGEDYSPKKDGKGYQFSIAKENYDEFEKFISNRVNSQTPNEEAPVPLIYNNNPIQKIEFTNKEINISYLRTTANSEGKITTQPTSKTINRKNSGEINDFYKENEGSFTDALDFFEKERGRNVINVIKPEKENISLSDPQNLAKQYPDKAKGVIENMKKANIPKSEFPSYELYIMENGKLNARKKKIIND